MRANGLAAVQRLELSALAARRLQPNIKWAHETTLGRDRQVLVTMGGILYPSGHRAEYSVTAERAFDPSGTQAVAGMRRQQLLVITEPVRSFAAGDAALVRQFPFHEVEVLTRSFSDLAFSQQSDAPGDWQIYNRVPLPPADLHRDVWPVGQRYGRIHPLPAWGPAVAARIRQVHTRLVHKLEARNIFVLNGLHKGAAQGLHALGVALSGVHTLFLRRKSSACSVCHSTVWPTAGLPAATSCWPNSARVASGWAATQATRRWWSAACSRGTGPPRWGSAATEPVLRWRLSSLLTKDTDTRKRRATVSMVN